MDISWYIIQKMGCFGTLICSWSKAGKCIFRPSGNSEIQNFTSGSKHDGQGLWQTLCQANNSPELKSESPWLF